MVLESFQAIPNTLSNKVICRQLGEYETYSLYDRDIAPIPLPNHLPVSIEMSLAVVSRITLVALLILALMGWGWRLTLLAMFIVARYARINIPRLLSKYRPIAPHELQLYPILHSDPDKSGLETAIAALRHRALIGTSYDIVSAPKLFHPDYHSVSRSSRAVSFERFRITSDIRDVPVGFDHKDMAMASEIRPTDPAELEAYLGQDDHSEQREYQIGLAFVGSSGHAEVVLRDGNLSAVAAPTNLDMTSRPPAIAPHKLVLCYHDELPRMDGIRVRLLHVRYPVGDRRSLELALEPRPSGRVSFYRFADLYRIQTTERHLRWLALQSCPARHCPLLNDCATFAYNFLTALLDHLKDRGCISEKQHYHQRLLLVWHNHVRNGVLAQSEVALRGSRSASDDANVRSSVTTSTVSVNTSDIPGDINGGIDEDL